MACAQVAHRLDGPRDHAGHPGRPQWTAPPPRLGVGEQHRHAVGYPHHQHHAGSRVTRASPSARGDRRLRVDHRDVGAVHLMQVGEPTPRGEVVQEVQVGHRLGGVAALEREVELVEGRRALTPPYRSVKARSTGPWRGAEGVQRIVYYSRARPGRRRRTGPRGCRARRPRAGSAGARLAGASPGGRRRAGADGLAARRLPRAGRPPGGLLRPRPWSRPGSAARGAPQHRALVAALGHAAVEAGRDHGDPHLVAEGVVDGGAEDDVGLGVRRLRRRAPRPR